MSSPSPNAATRSLLEVALGFIAAVLIVPLLFKTVTGLFKTVFKLGVTRRLLADAVFAGVTALLTRQDVLDAVFGKRGAKGDGLLKPDTTGNGA